LVTEAARRVSGSRISTAADAAVDAALTSLSEHLVDSDISINVDARTEWSYVWADKSVRQTIEADGGSDEI